MHPPPSGKVISYYLCEVEKKNGNEKIKPSTGGLSVLLLVCPFWKMKPSTGGLPCIEFLVVRFGK
jgi:hypothetical protein